MGLWVDQWRGVRWIGCVLWEDSKRIDGKKVLVRVMCMMMVSRGRWLRLKRPSSVSVRRVCGSRHIVGKLCLYTVLHRFRPRR